MQPRGITVTIASKALEKIRYWTEATDIEVSGLGLVRKVPGGFFIEDTYIIEQECGPGGTELDNDALAQFMLDLNAQGIDPGGLKFWWHR